MESNRARFLRSSHISLFILAGRMRCLQSASRKMSLPIVRLGPISFLPPSPAPLPLDKDAEAKRAAAVGQQLGNGAPRSVQYTTGVLLRGLTMRPDLRP